MKHALLACVITLAGCDCSGDTCPASADLGTVDVTVAGDTTGGVEVVLTASDGTMTTITAAGPIQVPAGTATGAAHRTRTSGPIVGTAYEATLDPTSLCVRAGESTPLTITVSADEASNRLWVTDLPVFALAAADLSATGAPAPAASLTGSLTNPNGAAFGPDGNLWMTDYGRIIAFANGDLGAGGAAAPVIVLDGPAIDDGSIPGVVELAFDEDGALWAAHIAGDRVMRFDPADLGASGQPTPTVTISGPDVDGAAVLAFDEAENLWVAGASEAFAMFASARLGADVSGAADVLVTGLSMPPVILPLGTPSSLAFDADGNLWAAHFGANTVALYTPADLAATGTVTPAIQVTVPVDVILEDIAIDEAGGIWLTGAMGDIDRLSPAQLAATGTATPATILMPTGLDYASSLVFYPPSAALPIAF